MVREQFESSLDWLEIVEHWESSLCKMTPDGPRPFVGVAVPLVAWPLLRGVDGEFGPVDALVAVPLAALRESLWNPLSPVIAMGTHLYIFIVVSPIVTHFFSHFLTLPKLCFTFFTSSLARARVSARTARERDICLLVCVFGGMWEKEMGIDVHNRLLYCLFPTERII